MKGLYFFVLTLSTSLSFAQNASCAGDGYGVTHDSQTYDYNNVFFAANARNGGNDFINHKSKSIPFENARIVIGKNIPKVYAARFNPYFNQIQIKDPSGNILNVKKVEGLKIYFLESNIEYHALAIDDINKSIEYLQSDGTPSLYKREIYNYIPAKKAITGYDNNKPESFKISTNYYYYDINNDLILLPKKKKEIKNNFPNLHKEIIAYIKNKKLHLTREKELAVLTDYIRNLELKNDVKYDVTILNQKNTKLNSSMEEF